MGVACRLFSKPITTPNEHLAVMRKRGWGEKAGRREANSTWVKAGLPCHASSLSSLQSRGGRAPFQLYSALLWAVISGGVCSWMFSWVWKVFDNAYTHKLSKNKNLLNLLHEKSKDSNPSSDSLSLLKSVSWSDTNILTSRHQQRALVTNVLSHLAWLGVQLHGAQVFFCGICDPWYT